jgi:hypothetical protein
MKELSEATNKELVTEISFLFQSGFLESRQKEILSIVTDRLENGRKAKDACKLASEALLQLHPIMNEKEPCNIYEAYKACLGALKETT